MKFINHETLGWIGLKRTKPGTATSVEANMNPFSKISTCLPRRPPGSLQPIDWWSAPQWPLVTATATDSTRRAAWSAGPWLRGFWIENNGRLRTKGNCWATGPRRQLVGGFNPSKDYQSTGMIIPNIWKNKRHVPVTTNQLYTVVVGFKMVY